MVAISSFLDINLSMTFVDDAYHKRVITVKLLIFIFISVPHIFVVATW